MSEESKETQTAKSVIDLREPYTAKDLVEAVLACSEEELQSRLSGMNNGFDHPNTLVLFGKAKAIALALQKETGEQQAEAQYVVGIMFCSEGERVALIRKNRPAWQKGLLNGIGGKIEAGETALEAMVREFREETGTEVAADRWSHYHTMQGREKDGSSFRVEFFATIGDLEALKTMEDEPIEIQEVSSLHPKRTDVVDNLSWSIGLAYDHMTDGRPCVTRTTY